MKKGYGFYAVAKKIVCFLSVENVLKIREQGGGTTEQNDDKNDDQRKSKNAEVRPCEVSSVDVRTRYREDDKEYKPDDRNIEQNAQSEIRPR